MLDREGGRRSTYLPQSAIQMQAGALVGLCSLITHETKRKSANEVSMAFACDWKTADQTQVHATVAVSSSLLSRVEMRVVLRCFANSYAIVGDITCQLRLPCQHRNCHSREE